MWFFFGICANCAGALINVPLNLFWSYFIDTAPGVPAPQSFGEYLLGILCAAAVPALCEELLCRGLVLREYENYGRRFAIIASAAAFALLHNSMQNLVFTLLFRAGSRTDRDADRVGLSGDDFSLCGQLFLSHDELCVAEPYCTAYAARVFTCAQPAVSMHGADVRVFFPAVLKTRIRHKHRI